jgi:diphthamide biosynthesis protein 7
MTRTITRLSQIFTHHPSSARGLAGMATVASNHSLTIELPPSCVAFCPTRPEYFVAGTYYLHPADQGESDGGGKTGDGDVAGSAGGGQKRSGSLMLFKVDGDVM